MHRPPPAPARQSAGQVGRAGGAVEQAHHAFDEDEVVALRRSMQALAAVGLAVHPQVQLVHRLAAGQLVPVRVQKVWPAPNTCTRKPRRACSRASAAVTVVLPCPEAGAAINKAGQRAAGCVMAFQGDGVVTGSPLQAHKQRAAGRGIGAGPTGSPCRSDCPRGPAGCSRAQCGCWRTG